MVIMIIYVSTRGDIFRYQHYIFSVSLGDPGYDMSSVPLACRKRRQKGEDMSSVTLPCRKRGNSTMRTGPQ